VVPKSEEISSSSDGVWSDEGRGFNDTSCDVYNSNSRKLEKAFLASSKAWVISA
jgi:hypothetical protein